MKNASEASEVERPAGISVPRMLTLVLLFGAAAAWECVALTSLKGEFIWSHLRMGSWILEHHSWPRTGLYSQLNQQPWRDFSWGYDVLAAIAERVFDLRALPLLAIMFRMALAGVTFLLAGGRRGHFWLAVGLSAAAQYVFWVTPLDSTNASIVLFGIALLVLLVARTTGKSKGLFLLPLLFVVWANLDLGFVYGILLLALFVVVTLIEGGGRVRSQDRPSPALPQGPLWTVGIGCVIATLCTPYGFRAYEAFFGFSLSDLYPFLPGYASLQFHRPQDYAVLLLAMGAALALGLKHSRDLFLVSLLAFFSVISFHAERESWLVVLAALAVIGDLFGQLAISSRQARLPGIRHGLLAVGITILIIGIVFFVRVPSDRATLLARTAETQPVHACDYIREHRLPQPLFNPYAWGGFVTWYLPEYPVSLDQRRGLFPEADEINYFKVMNARISYREYLPMKNARTLLLDKSSVMGEALRGMHGFKVAYEDDVSLVFLAGEKE